MHCVCCVSPPHASAVDAEPIDLIYPSPDKVFSSRFYGNEHAKNKVILIVAPTSPSIDATVFQSLYQPLMNLVYAGSVRLEIRLIGHGHIAFSTFLAAQCIEPESLPKFLDEYFTRTGAQLFESSLDVESYLTQMALSDPAFMPQGLNEDQFYRRMQWCLSHRKEGVVAEESHRHQAIYDYDLKNGGAVFTPAVIINGKPHEYDFSVTWLMSEIK